ncbi:hypothetical protein DFH06DRAFT_1446626 [Mycena polygramma]|nr:hypothetical protein DFH06DRAFT_1446626 [Mycena polygramma]
MQDPWRSNPRRGKRCVELQAKNHFAKKNAGLIRQLVRWVISSKDHRARSPSVVHPPALPKRQSPPSMDCETSAGIEILAGAPPYTYYRRGAAQGPVPRRRHARATRLAAVARSSTPTLRHTARKSFSWHEFLKKARTAVDLAPLFEWRRRFRCPTRLARRLKRFSSSTDQQQTNLPRKPHPYQYHTPRPAAASTVLLPHRRGCALAATSRPLHLARLLSAGGNYAMSLAVPAQVYAENAESGHKEEGKGEREARGAQISLHHRSASMLITLIPQSASTSSPAAGAGATVFARRSAPEKKICQSDAEQRARGRDGAHAAEVVLRAPTCPATSPVDPPRAREVEAQQERVASKCSSQPWRGTARRGDSRAHDGADADAEGDGDAAPDGGSSASVLALGPPLLREVGT